MVCQFYFFLCNNFEFQRAGCKIFEPFFFYIISVRVSNELGARRPKEAKFSVAVASLTSAMIGAIFMSIFFIWRTRLPSLFSDDKEVVDGAARLGYLLAVTVFFGNIGPVLSGI